MLPGQTLDMLEQVAVMGQTSHADHEENQLMMSRKMDALLTTGALVEPA